MSFNKLYTIFFALVLSFLHLPLTQGAFYDPKSSGTSDHYEISSPLVLMVGIQEYPYTNDYDDLPGVEKDMNILYELFANKCEYEVRSTYHEGPSKVGKTVKKGELDTFLHLQYNYLRLKRDFYDSLIFVFSGHGGGTSYGNDTMVTSDGKEMPLMDVVSKFTPKHDKDFAESFAYKPKLFFKLACRGGKETKVVQSRGNKGVYKKNDWVDTNSEVFIACASTPGVFIPDYIGGKYAKLFSNFVVSSIASKKYDLLDIDRQVRLGLKGDQVTETVTRLNNKVFFSTRKKTLNDKTEKEWWKAIGDNNADKVKEILTRYNIDMDTTNDYGYTPLHIAAKNNSAEVIDKFIAAGANLNAIDKNGWTPLHIASRYNYVVIAKKLIAAKVDLNATDNNRKTPLHIAAGANLNAIDKNGWTPLHKAAYYNYVVMAKKLIAAGANKDAKDHHWFPLSNFKKTPLDIAKKYKNKAMIKYLLNVDNKATDNNQYIL